jgi:hypothetical protein
MLHSGFFLGLFFGPEDGNDKFLRNTWRYHPEDFALHRTGRILTVGDYIVLS